MKILRSFGVEKVTSLEQLRIMLFDLMCCWLGDRTRCRTVEGRVVDNERLMDGHSSSVMVLSACLRTWVQQNGSGIPEMRRT